MTAADLARWEMVLRRLHDGPTAEVDRLEGDIRAAASRRLHALHYDLSMLRGRMVRLLGDTSRMLAEVNPSWPGPVPYRPELFEKEDA